MRWGKYDPDRALLAFRHQSLSQFRHCHVGLRLRPLSQLENRTQLTASRAPLAVTFALPVRFLRCMTRTALECIDPVKICSCYKGDGSDECDDGRQHQTVDGEA